MHPRRQNPGYAYAITRLATDSGSGEGTECKLVSEFFFLMAMERRLVPPYGFMWLGKVLHLLRVRLGLSIYRYETYDIMITGIMPNFKELEAKCS